MPRGLKKDSLVFTVGIYQEYGSLDMDGIPQKPLIPDDIKLPTTARDAAYILQVAANTVFRHAAGNTKALFDLTPQGANHLDFVRSKGGFFKFATTGVTSRFAYSGLGLLPSLRIGEAMTDSGFSKTSAVAASTGWETLVGSALEVRGLRKSRPEMVNSFAGFQGCIFPFAIRNCLGWIAINGVEKSNPFSAFSAGFFAGAISALPDTVGVKAMYQLSCNSQSRICSAKEIAEALKNGFVGAIRNLTRLGVAASVRGSAGGVSTLILSKQLREGIVDGLNYLFGKSNRISTEDVSEVANSFSASEVPTESSLKSTASVENPSAQKLNLQSNEKPNSSSRC